MPHTVMLLSHRDPFYQVAWKLPIIDHVKIRFLET